MTKEIVHKIIITFLTKIESVAANARRKVLKDGTRMDGIIKETLSNTACSSKAPSEVIQETEEKEISDNQKSDEKNCFDMFEYE